MNLENNDGCGDDSEEDASGQQIIQASLKHAHMHSLLSPSPSRQHIQNVDRQVNSVSSGCKR